MDNNKEIEKNINEIKNILDNLKKEFFSKIGNCGNIWTGDAAMIAASTFETLNTKFDMYEQKLKKYLEKEGE